MAVGLLQLGGRERGRQLAGIPDRDPVGKDVNLHAGVGLVVAVGECVDDDLGNGGLGDLVGDGVCRPGIAHTYLTGKLGHDKIGRLIDQLEEIALEDLIVRDGFDGFGAVEVQAFDLGGREPALRLLAKEEDSGLGELVVGKQIEMSERFADGRVRGERVEQAASQIHDSRDLPLPLLFAISVEPFCVCRLFIGTE